MLFANQFVLVGRRALLSSLVLRGEIVFADFACLSVAGRQTLVTQRAVATLLRAKVKNPAVVKRVTIARAALFSVGTSHCVAGLVELEIVRLKQLRIAWRLLLGRHEDRHLRPVRIITERLEHRAVVTDGIDREAFDVVAVCGFFALDQLPGIGGFIAVGRQEVNAADQVGVGILADVEQIAVVLFAGFIAPRCRISQGAELVTRFWLAVAQHFVRQCELRHKGFVKLRA